MTSDAVCTPFAGSPILWIDIILAGQRRGCLSAARKADAPLASLRAGTLAAADMESAVRQRPGVAEVSFELPQDDSHIATVVEAIFQTHSYQKPVIRVVPILTSRSKGVDDKDNPNRWWNTTGDRERVGGVAR